ncbi:hypothetical protein F4212_15775, partial [Candidatus Poribacteria bacterium]|nr:hypothetical protein [Candidatus Poribacteria bacterium]
MNRESIKQALAEINTGDFLEKTKELLSTIGYQSQRTLELSGTVQDFFTEFPPPNPNTKTEQKFRKYAKSVKIIFQFTSDEIEDTPQLSLLESNSFDKGNYSSFLFCAVELKDNTYSRTKYAEFTREINKRLGTPTVVLFRTTDHLTIAFSDRRPNLINETRDVLGQVTLIKDIRLKKPHTAHLDILSELSLEECVKWIVANNKQKNFDGLLAAWLDKLDTEELNKQFYSKLFAWYQWAVEDEENVKFPTDEKRVIKREEHVIRLITRLLFIWFIKEKGLVTEELFTKAQIEDHLKEDDFDNGDSYYRVVLQNLFFATLNTEIDKRGFSNESPSGHRDFSRYRYKKEMRDPDELLKLFAKTPFINGGLFDCLDSFEATRDGGYRIDCFSDKQYQKLSIPNRFFFDQDHGLIRLLEHYKFTVEENTPIDQEVALDPELLGRVFENLLAAINPETGETARKMTGSYYTPRAIVDYMVEESLVATLTQKCDSTEVNAEHWGTRLRYLFDYMKSYDDPEQRLDDNESEKAVRAISELKILDPAVGSGAFPMGVLHKLTLALRRLDPDNNSWEALQTDIAIEKSKKAYKTQVQDERDDELTEISDTFEQYSDSDFGRKLYLIQNSIFGVDIQPIACQIAKLRFFISLAIEQEKDENAHNFGIKPLPNLETRFVAANTLIGLKMQIALRNQEAADLEKALLANREKHFHATTRQKKRACKDTDKRLRAELAAELKALGAFADEADRIAEWDPYDQNATAEWFDSEWMFGVADGYDVVIGNPPYIQLQKEGGKLANLYQDKGFDTFTRMGDIYCLFYEKGIQLLKNKDHLCLITSNKWMRAGYGKKLRDFFATYTQPNQLLDLGPDVFDATVDTNILLLQNGTLGVPVGIDAVTIGADFDKQTDNISQYLINNGATMETPDIGAPWAILSAAELNLKRKIEDIGKPLKDWDINIYLGIVTGCNEAFIIDQVKRDQLIAQDPKSAEIIKPVLRGRDIKRYNANWEGLYLIGTFPALNLDINDYPAVKNYLIEFGKDRLEQVGKTLADGTKSRKKTGNDWFETQDQIAYYTEFEKEKVVWGNIAFHSTFCYSDPREFINAPANLLTSKSNDTKYLLACMNSKVFNWEFANLGIPLGYSF